MQYNDKDIMDFLLGFKKTKEQMINDYINGKITKQQLDVFMERENRREIQR